MEELSLRTLELAQSGNTEAYRELIRVFERPVHHTVYRLVGTRFPGEVDDITQDIFVKLFRALPQFDVERGTKLSSWVFTFVKNYCFDVLKRRRLPQVSLEQPGDAGRRQRDLESADPGPPERLAAREIQQAIARAVDELPKEQKVAFVLREYESLPYGEIAEITGSSEGTVKSRIHRAKEALRYRLRALVYDAEGGLA